MGGGVDWILTSVRRGVVPANENMTSLYVYEAVRHTLGWAIEEVIPQAHASRGPVDYRIRSKSIRGCDLLVEVKAFSSGVDSPKAIRSVKKYLVRKGKAPKDIR